MPPTKKRRAQNEEEIEEVPGVETPIPKRRRKGINYDPGEICQEVYEAIRSHKTEDGRLLCETFLRVPKRRNEPEYYDIISHPIDLMKIQSRLKNEEYDDIDQMAEDIELIVSNTKMYYSETTLEFADATALIQLFNEVKVVVLAKKFGDEPTTSTKEQLPESSENTYTPEQFESTVPSNMDESTNDLVMEGDDEEEGDEDDGEVETSEHDNKKNVDMAETENNSQSQKPKRRKRRRAREVIAESTVGEDDNVKPHRMSLREKEPQDFRALICARGRGRPPKDDSVSRDERENDESSTYEDLLTAIVNAKENDRVICEFFKVLPHKQVLPGYYEVIKEPMDLKMIAQKIQRNQYTSVDDMFKDLILMVNNARSFNEPGSQIYRDAAALRRLIVEKKIEMSQPKPTRPTRSRLRRGQKEKVSAVIAALEYNLNPIAVDMNTETISLPGDTAEEASETEGSVIDDAEMRSPLWSLYHSVKKYRDSMGQSLCEPFLRLPNRRFYPDYYEEIEKPITLPKIKTRLKNGQYKTLDKLYSALDIMFENAKRYNVEGSKIHMDAVKLQEVMRGKYKELATRSQGNFMGQFPNPQSQLLYVQCPSLNPMEIVPAPVPLEIVLQEEIWGDSSDIVLKKTRKSFETASVTSEEGGGTPKRKPGRKPAGEDTLKRRLWTLYKTVFDYQFDGRKLIDMFVTLPSKKDYPNYFQVISEPIDMTMIENKIKENKYTNDHMLIQDFEMMFNNARNYNEESSQIYKDAETLERILRAKIKSLPPLEGSPLVTGKACRKVFPGNPQVQRFQDLYNYIKDYSDSKGRILSTPFIKLPPKQEYPDYYEVIKKPIDMMRINQKISCNQYASLEDMVSDFVQIFDNACKYNEPDSVIYKDALTLQRVCLEKKQELIPLEDGSGVPDVRALVQEMMTNLFISTYNHVDEEGRCYSDSFLELPAVEVEVSTAGQTQIPKRRPSFQHVKRNLDRGRYRRMDRFQEDMMEVFEYARRVSRSDSQLYEDAVELQLFFIRMRDDICSNGETFITSALSYTEQMLNIAVEMEKKEKIENEMKEDEKRRLREESREKDEKSEDQGEDSYVYNGHTYTVGDFVKIEPREPSLEYHVVLIERLVTDEKGDTWINGNFFLQPQETFHLATRKFLQKEVFKSDKYETISFSKVTGICFVMNVKEYFKSKPEGLAENDVFVCESRYSSRLRLFKKIKVWQVPKNENIKLVPREIALTPVRVASVFVEKTEASDSENEEHSVLDKQREVVVAENTHGSEDGNIYYQQLQVASGWFKIGDFAYVQQMGVKTVITRIDKMWTNSAGDAFIYGPTYVHPFETEHLPTRTFYQREVFKTSYEDTHWMDNILGRCVAMPFKDFVSCRLTEILEKDVFICEAKYIEVEKQIKKFLKPTSMINPSSLSIRVCDDEVYFFKKQITPQKVPSPQLLDIQQQSFALDDSAMTGFDENSSQLDGSYTDGFNLPVTFGLEMQEQTAAPEPEVVSKSHKKKGARKGKGEKNPKELKRHSKKKGNVSGYIMFAAEFRKDIVRSHKDLSFGEISKIVGQKWKTLEKEQKEVYEALAVKKQAELKAKHAAAEKAFNDSLKAIQQNASPVRESQSPHISKNSSLQHIQCAPQTPHGYSQNSNQGYPQSPYQQQQPLQQQQYIQGGQQQYIQQTIQSPSMRPATPGGQYSNQTRLPVPHSSTTSMPFNPKVAPSTACMLQPPVSTPPQPNNAMSLQQQTQQGMVATSTPVNQQLLSQQQPTQQQMGPPPPPPRPPSPMFVSVPPRTQRLLHSEAYLKYIENLRPDRQDVSNWRKQLTATEENTCLSTNSKLPIHWLGNGIGHHENASSALWALRDLLVKDTLAISRNLEYSELW